MGQAIFCLLLTGLILIYPGSDVPAPASPADRVDRPAEFLTDPATWWIEPFTSDGSMRNALLAALLAFSIVASFQPVRSLLVFAFLIGTPATATLLVRRVPVIMATAVALGAFSVIIGLLIGHYHNTAPGATMAFSAVVVFLLVLVATSTCRALFANQTGRTLLVEQPRPARESQ